MRTSYPRALFICLFFLTGFFTKAQTTLSPGDISIIGFSCAAQQNHSGPYFVTWVNLAPNTVIRFTNNAFNGTSSAASGAYRYSKNEMIWTNTSGATIVAGTVIGIDGNGTSATAVATVGSITITAANGVAVTSLNLGSTGDKIFAYQGTGCTTASSNIANAIATFSGTVIYGIGFAGTSTTAGWLTTGTTGTNTNSFVPSEIATYSPYFGGSGGGRSGTYTGPRSGSSFASLKALVNNPSNWTIGTSASPQVTYDLTSFTAGTAPSITGQPASGVNVCSGSGTSISVTANNATGYQWQVNTGLGFSSISNGSTYTNATTATLSISNVTASMNGYTYRVVVTGTATPNATSTACTLNVSNITATTLQTNVSCNGGSNGIGAVTASGGIGDYTYSWAPSGGTGATASGLSARSYTVTITDANACSINKSFTITQPSALTSTTSQINIPCNGGTSGRGTVTPTGGTLPYSYSWSPSGGTAATASGLSAGTYTITITDSNACSINKNITITQPPALTSTTSQTNIICNGGTGIGTVSPTGGTIPYSYAWSPSGGAGATASGLSAGSYTVTITDANSCTLNKNFTITEVLSDQWLGTVDSTWSNTANWSCGSLPTSSTNVTISSSAPNMPVVDIPNAVTNNLTINTGATLSVTTAGSNLAIYGTLLNNGTYNNTSGKTTFAGSMQNVPPGNYDNLEITGSGTKTLTGAVTVNDTLTVNAGYLKLGNFDLTINSGGGISPGASSSNYIITNGTGTLKQEYIGLNAITSNVLFPVGTTSSYTPVSLTNTGTADVFGVRVSDGISTAFDGTDTPTGTALLTNNVNKTWLVTEGTPGGSNVTLTFQWNGSDEQSGFNRGSCFASHYYSNAWHPDFIGSAGGTDPYTRSLSNITSFSPFGIGNVGTVLPLNLISFTGKTTVNGNVLTWTTSNEINTSFFNIERSTDGTNFTSVGSVNAGQQQYHFTDSKDLNAAAVYYYRLKITDNNGAYKYAATISVKGSGKVLNIYSIFPNPATGATLYVTAQTNATDNAVTTITDVFGNQWQTGTLQGAALNSGKATINVAALPAGTYFLQIRDAKTNTTSMLKFEKQ